ncbi:MAG: hypothetical protein Satyrvirus11_9 [Satyrvirus sp.]|uniref:Uncharacterized protein n=1 Tax=Satyrvirus sp. TaxID=2487771 RepID=A0A3G5ADS5_9VIRU|nr:MAG: hypothetical protein Satyrvirus11_9 [Satyrvirus sp.]
MFFSFVSNDITEVTKALGIAVEFQGKQAQLQQEMEEKSQRRREELEQQERDAREKFRRAERQGEIRLRILDKKRRLERKMKKMCEEEVEEEKIAKILDGSEDLIKKVKGEYSDEWNVLFYSPEQQSLWQSLDMDKFQNSFEELKKRNQK